MFESRAEDLSSPLRAVLEIGARVTLDEYVAARRRRFGFVKVLDELLGEDAVLATPTMCVEGFTADGRTPGAAEPGTTSEVYNTQAQNITGHPAISLPAGLSANGVPFGLQLTGPRFADDQLLSLERDVRGREPVAARGSRLRTVRPLRSHATRSRRSNATNATASATTEIARSTVACRGSSPWSTGSWPA